MYKLNSTYVYLARKYLFMYVSKCISSGDSDSDIPRGNLVISNGGCMERIGCGREA